MGKVVALKSALLSRIKSFSKLGLQFGGKRDLYGVLGYDRNVNLESLMQLYCRQDIAGRIVDAYPNATWEKSPQVKEEDSSNQETEFDKKFKELANKLQLWHYLERADRLSGIGEYGVLFIGTKGPLERSVPRLNGIEDIKYLAPYAQNAITISEVETDPSSERFGKPKFYNIDLVSHSESVLSASLTGSKRPHSTPTKVHYSRIIHLADNVLDNEIYGQPRLLRVYNLFTDLAKVVGGSAEMFWLNAHRGMQVDVDKDMILDEDDEDDLTDEVEEYQDGLRRFIRTKGVNINAFEAQIADPKNTFSVIMSLISGTTGIPQRVLMGAEQGQLASEQDERNWNSRIKERQESYAETRILRPFISFCQDRRALPQANYNVIWPDLTVLNDETRSMVAVRNSQAIKNVAETNETVVTVKEFRKHWLGLDEDNSDLNETLPPQNPSEKQTIDDDNEALPKRRDDIDTV